jgi:hypothetical protein
MTTSGNVQTPSTYNTMSTQRRKDYKARGRRTWVCFHEIWNLTSFAMATKTSQTTSCEVVLSSRCSQWNKLIPIGSKGWLQMQCDTSRTKRWERPNLVRNAMEKTSKNKRKKRMIGWANNQALTLGPAYNLKSVWCELEGKSKRMLIKEWSCNLFEILS